MPWDISWEEAEPLTRDAVVVERILALGLDNESLAAGAA
jgi:hypothetical protein